MNIDSKHQRINKSHINYLFIKQFKMQLFKGILYVFFEPVASNIHNLQF